MRIIAGSARGRRLKAPKGRALRPTAARVKEALFDILQHELSGAKVLDLFAGTGNLTVEALSRGAVEAILVDASAQSARTIRENLRRLDLTDCAKVLITPVSRAMRLLGGRRETFDIIFLDPPYDQGLVEKTIRMIARNGLLRNSGSLVAEHSVREAVSTRYDGLELSDQRRYGDTLLSFFRTSGYPVAQRRDAGGGEEREQKKHSTNSASPR